MLIGSLRPSNHRPCKPGRRAGRKGILLQGHPRPWPFAKPRTFGAPAPKVPHRIRSVSRETATPASTIASYRHVQLRCGSAQYQRSTVLTSRPVHLWHRSSKVVFNLGAIPQQHCRDKPVKDASGVQEAAVPAAGAEDAVHQAWASRPLSLLPSRAARHPLRRFARITVIASYFYSKDSACSRAPLYPAPPLSRAHSFGPSRPRPGRRSANRTMSVFVGVWEPKVSQPLCRQSPPSPSRQTTSPATLHFVPRPWSLGDSKSGSRPDRIRNRNVCARNTVPP